MFKSDYTGLRSRASALWLCLLFLYILLLPTTAETGTAPEPREHFVVTASSEVAVGPAGMDRHP